MPRRYGSIASAAAADVCATPTRRRTGIDSTEPSTPPSVARHRPVNRAGPAVPLCTAVADDFHVNDADVKPASATTEEEEEEVDRGRPIAGDAAEDDPRAATNDDEGFEEVRGATGDPSARHPEWDKNETH